MICFIFPLVFCCLCLSLAGREFGIVLAHQRAKFTETEEEIMSRRKDMALMLTGAVLGASLVSGAAAAGVMAELTWQKIYVDGEHR